MGGGAKSGKAADCERPAPARLPENLQNTVAHCVFANVCLQYTLSNSTDSVHFAMYQNTLECTHMDASQPAASYRLELDNDFGPAKTPKERGPILSLSWPFSGHTAGAKWPAANDSLAASLGRPAGPPTGRQSQAATRRQQPAARLATRTNETSILAPRPVWSWPASSSGALPLPPPPKHPRLQELSSGERPLLR